MSKVERIQEEKAKTIASMTGKDKTDSVGLSLFSSDSEDSQESGNIRVIDPTGDANSDISVGDSDFAVDFANNFSSGISVGKSKAQREKEFRSQKTSSTITGNSATIDPTTASSGINPSGTVAKESVEDVLGKQAKNTDTTEKPATGSNSTIKNPLEDFATYNCIFTFGVLSPSSINEPENNYKVKGATYTILRSGGGTGNNRITTGFEDNGNLEYFIDDFVMTSIISPNQRTGISLGTRMSFKVYEPYSLGIFLQSLEIAAVKAGYQNYLKAPYLMDISFVGWDADGFSKPAGYSNRRIPIQLVNIEFDVDSGGSVYEVEAIPWNEITLADDVQSTNDPVEIRGATVAEVLSFGEQSLTAVLNQKQKEIAEKDELPISDLFVIRFPKSRVKSGEVNSSSIEAGSATISKNNTENSNVISTEQYKSRVGNYFSAAGTQSNNNVYQKLVGDTTTDVNRIGSSKMVENYNQGSNHPFPRALYDYDKEANIYRRDGIELSLSDNERTFKFPQGMKIQKIIEEIVLISNYGENATKALDKEGMATWFKVETSCYVLNNPQFEEAKGRKPRVYVFNVVPYKVHGGIVTPPNKGNPGAEQRAKQVSKRYNYIYSGENKDVLSFDIQFRTAFFESIRADRSNEGDGDRKGESSSRVQEDEKTTKGADSTPGDIKPIYSLENTNGAGAYTGGGSESDAKKNLAKEFHNTLLNSKADLITANVEIWGDPYYLPDSGMGNYSDSNSGTKATMTANGSIDYQRTEIDVLVNFKTPVDYDSANGMSFQSDTTTINGFSGFYQVITVESTISGNKFTQNLEMIRRRNQSLDGIGGHNIVEKQQAGTSGTGRAEQTGTGSTPNSFASDTPGSPNSFASDTPGPPPSGITPLTDAEKLAIIQRNR